ncbi:MAG: acetylxylan esterase [Armatimonadetes bacterium]|nr:acetylxylan esterase [Armatimonadota bacterium]
MRRWHMAVAAILAIWAGPGLAAPGASSPANPALFQYDGGQPLDVKERAVRQREGIAEHEITFASPKGGRVPAYLLVPNGKGPFAGIILMHGATGSRRSLLPGARLLCQAGAVCLLPNAPLRGERAEMGKPADDFSRPELMRDGLIQAVVELRRCVDVLLARPDVDPKRIGFYGSSLGGSLGGLLAGVEKRVAAHALGIASGNWVEAFQKSEHPLVRLARRTISKEQLAKATAVLAPLDPVHYVGRAAPAALLFQNGRADSTVPAECAQAYQDAGSQPKTCRWYDAGHELDIQAFQDRAAWFGATLGLGPVATPGSNRGLSH